MKAQTLYTIQKELQHRWKYKYRWFKKQDDAWDAYSNFIYKTDTWEALMPKIKMAVEIHKLDKRLFFYYTINRWYNFWSAVAIQDIFCKNSRVIAATNTKDKHVDFFIDELPFDHKTSVFPKGFEYDLDYAKSYEKELISWFYTQQSSQRRQHYHNRLFVVVHAKDGQHWKLKAKLLWLQGVIETYMQHFDTQNLYEFHFKKGTTTKAGILWAVE